MTLYGAIKIFNILTAKQKDFLIYQGSLGGSFPLRRFEPDRVKLGASTEGEVNRRAPGLNQA